MVAASLCQCDVLLGNASEIISLNYSTPDSLLPLSKLNAPFIYIASLHALNEPNPNSVSFGPPISFSCLQALS
jgi:hypothetical protein